MVQAGDDKQRVHQPVCQGAGGPDADASVQGLPGIREKAFQLKLILLGAPVLKYLSSANAYALNEN